MMKRTTSRRMEMSQMGVRLVLKAHQKKRDNGLLRQTRYDLENLERQIDL